MRIERDLKEARNLGRIGGAMVALAVVVILAPIGSITSPDLKTGILPDSWTDTIFARAFLALAILLLGLILITWAAVIAYWN